MDDFLQNHQFKHREHTQEEEIEQGEHQYIPQHTALVVLGILPESDQTGQRGNQGAHAADVDTHQQLLIILGELAQQNGCGNVTDKLTACRCYKQCAFFKKE